MNAQKEDPSIYKQRFKMHFPFNDYNRIRELSVIKGNNIIQDEENSEFYDD